MSDNSPTPSAPASKVGGVMRKRVFGVPVLYLVGVVVLVFAVYAWRAKATAKAPAETSPVEESGDVTDVGAYPSGGELYPTPSTGTVVVSPAAAQADTNANSSIDTNREWLVRGVAFLGSQGVGGGVAQAALQSYLDGAQLSTVQGTYRDRVIAELGLPPDPVDSPEPTAAAPTGYVRRSGSAAIYAVLSDGTLDWIDRGEWDAAGRPAPTDIPAGDPIWNRKVSGGPDAPDAFKVGMG